MMRPASCAVAMAFAFLLVTERAVAQDSATAQVLFDEAIKLMDAKEFAAACPKLAESQRLEPAIGTLFNLGDCYQETGRTASAWTSFVAAADEAAAAHQGERERVARARALALEPRLTRIRIVVREPAPGETILRDGAVVGASQWDLAVPVDPGSHTVTATATGREGWSEELNAKDEGTVTTVEVPPLRLLVRPEVVVPAPAPATDPTPVRAWMRPTALALGATGLVAAGVGTIFGARSLSKASDASRHCDQSTCDDIGFPLNDDAIVAGDRATAFFLISGVTLTAGLVLWFLSPSSPRTSAASGALRW